MARLPEDVRSAFRLFGFYLAEGTLDLELLDGFDYRPAVMNYGSGLEMVLAVFANVLDVNEAGQVTNYGDAEYRAAQWIRRFCDDQYLVDPPFAAWETELL
ncbi:hypothetical protein Aab01nite_07390 [Paractinoplanes abujensis]|uniref:DUF7677 domain-containing protein n=1 Tax=Paractinoplanes abujensis TaxID=882441 RepID=A0A7W7CMS8_9ACTN|nr:hypothetical protein [Actinoplanes abujensis]MBB4691437.1 hypothetical protein [Actinoplanes abujensis]GID17149.1 hypothetical protein Aab01nite_07390 [Actinoplanes abujensis]